MRTFNYKSTLTLIGLNQTRYISATRPGESNNIYIYSKRGTVLNIEGNQENYNFYMYSDPRYSIGSINSFNLNMRDSCLEINGWAGDCRDNFNVSGNRNRISLKNSLLYIFNITGQNNRIRQDSRKANYRIGTRYGALGGAISSGTEITLTYEADSYPVLPHENSSAYISLISVGSSVTVKRENSLNGISASNAIVWLGVNQHLENLANTDPEGNWQPATWTATERDSYNVQAINFTTQISGEPREIFNINGNGYRVNFDYSPGAVLDDYSVCNVFANYVVLKDLYGVMKFNFEDRNVDGRVYLQGSDNDDLRTNINWIGSSQARFASLVLKGNVLIDMKSKDNDSDQGWATMYLNFGLPGAVQGDQSDTFVLIRNNRKHSSIWNGIDSLNKDHPAAGAIQKLTIEVGVAREYLLDSIVDPVKLDLYTTGNTINNQTIVNDKSKALHLDTTYGILLNIYGVSGLDTYVFVEHENDHFSNGVSRDRIDVHCSGFLDLTCSDRSDIDVAFTESKTIRVSSSEGNASSQMTLNIDQHAQLFRSAWTIDDYVDGLLVNLGAYSSFSNAEGYSIFWNRGFIDVQPVDSFGNHIHISIRDAAGVTQNYVNNTNQTQQMVFSYAGTVNSAGLTLIP